MVEIRTLNVSVSILTPRFSYENSAAESLAESASYREVRASSQVLWEQTPAPGHGVIRAGGRSSPRSGPGQAAVDTGGDNQMLAWH